VNGSTYVSETFAKSTLYLACGHGHPPRLERRAKLEVLDRAWLNGRLRHGDFGGHRLLRGRWLFFAQGRGKAQRIDVDYFDWLTDHAHSVSS
jgi:hypothetical protein